MLTIRGYLTNVLYVAFSASKMGTDFLSITLRFIIHEVFWRIGYKSDRQWCSRVGGVGTVANRTISLKSITLSLGLFTHKIVVRRSTPKTVLCDYCWCIDTYAHTRTQYWIGQHGNPRQPHPLRNNFSTCFGITHEGVESFQQISIPSNQY